MALAVIEEFDGEVRDGQRLALEYDFLKHLTSLAVFAIGGIITFAGSIFEHVANKRPLWLAAVLIGVAGLIAFFGQLTLIERLDPARRKLTGWRAWVLGRPTGSPATLRTVAVGLLAVGIGLLGGFAVEVLG